jgi:hypothetical protein
MDVLWTRYGRVCRGYGRYEPSHHPLTIRSTCGLVDGVVATARASRRPGLTHTLFIDTAQITETAFALRAVSRVSPYGSLLSRIGAGSAAVANGDFLPCFPTCTAADGSALRILRASYADGSLAMELALTWHDGAAYKFEEWSVTLRHAGSGRWVVVDQKPVRT